MFIREKSKKVNGKKRYIQHQLIESIRTPSGPRQQIVLNLGHLCLPEEKWKALANCIEGFLTNQKSLFPKNPEIEAIARHYASQIRQERLGRAQECIVNDKAAVKEDAHYEQVDINSLITNDAKTIGAEHVVISQMNEYGFDTILNRLDFTKDQITYSKMLIVGRMVHPGSERETVRWLSETSGARELLGGEVKLYDTALHRTAVLLWENHAAIEQELSARAREIFSLKETVILYDLTNTYFEGSKTCLAVRQGGSKVARHGKSQKTCPRENGERRNDYPLITLSLTIDEEGFPKQSKVWEGNVSETDTLKDMLLGLKKEDDLFPNERTIVMDAGIATEDNIALIKKNGYKYVVVSRKKSYDEEDAVGTYVLRTNRLDLGGEEISKLHRSLATVEESFENMKGDLPAWPSDRGLRPNFPPVKAEGRHHTDIHTIAHVHVTVLAYHMLAGILKKLRTAGIHYNWNTIRDILATHIRVTTTMNIEDDHVIDVRTCTTLMEKQHMIYNKLQIKHSPLGRKYMKSSIKTQRCSAETCPHENGEMKG